MSPRRLIVGLWVAAALAVPTMATSTAGAAIEPPWCGTPMPDAAENLPTVGPGAFPHIPYYAIGCTLDSIAARSNGRMTVERFGQSALGRDKYLVVINALDTKAQRRGYANWKKVRRFALEDPAYAQKILARVGDKVKVPLFVQGGIHGNEYEGVDAAMQVIERLATTPYGTDPEVDKILDQSFVIFNPVQNPDGRIAGTRANGNGFDLNRDFLTQSQPEVTSAVAIMQRFLPPETLDLHGYVTPTLIEATTKPHNPGIEYDLWLKWNQSRIDANEAAMNAQGFLVTRPINDWCADGSIPENGVCDDGTTRFGPRWAESWDDWGPFYTPMYSQLVGLNGSTVEMCNSTSTVAGSSPPSTPCGPPVSDNEKIGRRGSRMAQYITVWSTLLFDTTNRVDLMHDQLEIYRRGVIDAARPPLASFPPDFRTEENYWMHEYPQAYVIPLGEAQRSDPEAKRLVRWLLTNGIRVQRLQKDYKHGSTDYERGSYVVFMDQPLRGLADTALGPGVDVSSRIGVLYAPPGAWSHGELWGADVVTIPDGANFRPKSQRIWSVRPARGGVDASRGASAFALELDSPTAVRTLNALLNAGVTAELASAPFTNARGEQMPAGTVLFPASAENALDDAGEDAGVWFIGVRGTLPAREPIDRSPRIAVLTGALTQEIWVLRNLGFTADPVSAATINTAPTDPLVNYDVIFNTGTYPADTPANATVRSRLANFFANGGGYLGAMFNGANFLVSGGQVTGLTPATVTSNATRSVRGWSGIITWANSASGTSQITGAYPAQDRAIVDPPVWFTSVPSGWTVDGSLPLTGFFLSGLWKIDGDAQSASAPGSAMIAHGTNTAGTARMTSFAMNPLYRADPEREWPMLASAALWADQ
ncbi:MAG TPA: M14 family zinc carboxypeptidase [Gaiellaceae bacterium]|nr:M14 family zinc carboxypeptidase [Gaiellaceae bacterium]